MAAAKPATSVDVNNKDGVENKSLSENDKKETIFTESEISKHKTTDDCWMIIGENGEKKVYNITGFLDDHPGGPEILMDLAGQDATDEFEDIGHSQDARNMLPGLCIGKLHEDPAKAKRKAQVFSTKPESKGNNALFFVLAFIITLLALLFSEQGKKLLGSK